MASLLLSIIFLIIYLTVKYLRYLRLNKANNVAVSKSDQIDYRPNNEVNKNYNNNDDNINNSNHNNNVSKDGIVYEIHEENHADNLNAEVYTENYNVPLHVNDTTIKRQSKIIRRRCHAKKISQRKFWKIFEAKIEELRLKQLNDSTEETDTEYILYNELMLKKRPIHLCTKQKSKAANVSNNNDEGYDAEHEDDLSETERPFNNLYIKNNNNNNNSNNNNEEELMMAKI